MRFWAAAQLLGLCLLLHSCTTEAQLNPPSLQPGVLYQYHYTLHFEIGHIAQPTVRKSSLKAEAKVETHLLWRSSSRPDEQLIQVQINEFKVHHVLEEKNSSPGLSPEDLLGKEAIAHLKLPVLFHWRSGKVEAFFGTTEGSSQTLDLKRGLVSLFQLQLQSGTELDVSGECSVTYEVSGRTVTKKKDLRTCTGATHGHTSVNKLFGVQWQPTSESHYTLNGNLIQSVVADEAHTVSLTLKSSVGSRVTSRQQLELVSTLAGPEEVPGQNLQEVLSTLPGKYQAMEITSQPLKSTCQHCPSLINYLKKTGQKPMRINLAKPLAARRFNFFVQMLRYAKKKDVLQLLQKSSGDMVPFLMDVAVAAQSSPTLSALSEFLDFSKKNQVALHEKFLYAAAFAAHPSTELLKIVLDKLTGKVADSTVLTTGIIVTGAIVGKLCQIDLCNEEVVEYAKATLVEGLREAKKESEEITYLLSLKNAQIPETIPLLLDYAEEDTGAVSSAALAALASFLPPHITTEVKETLRRIFHENRQKYDKAARLAAAEILLAANPLIYDFTHILLALETMEKETAKLLLSKIKNILNTQQSARNVVQQLLKDPHFNNYYRLSRTGGSSVFSGLLAASDEMMSTYSLELLYTETGLLRRSHSDFSLLSHGHQLRAAQVSFEASGFDSLLGTGTGEEEEDQDQEVMAGMSAILFDVQLRPIVFFKGYMDLVSKVFANNGDPTNIVEGNILLIDHLQGIALQSGMQITVEFLGGLGLEIYANVDVSLWDQDSKTNIKTKSALVIDFKVDVTSPFYQAQVKTRTEAETSLNFNTIAKFLGAPVQICLQLSQDKLPYKEVFTLVESFPQQNTTNRVCKGRSATMPGREFPLHRANSDMCKILLPEEPIAPPDPLMGF